MCQKPWDLWDLWVLWACRSCVGFVGPVGPLDYQSAIKKTPFWCINQMLELLCKNVIFVFFLHFCNFLHISKTNEMKIQLIQQSIEKYAALQFFRRNLRFLSQLRVTNLPNSFFFARRRMPTEKSVFTFMIELQRRYNPQIFMHELPL